MQASSLIYHNSTGHVMHVIHNPLSSFYARNLKSAWNIFEMHWSYCELYVIHACFISFEMWTFLIKSFLTQSSNENDFSLVRHDRLFLNYFVHLIPVHSRSHLSKMFKCHTHFLKSNQQPMMYFTIWNKDLQLLLIHPDFIWITSYSSQSSI